MVITIMTMTSMGMITITAMIAGESPLFGVGRGVTHVKPSVLLQTIWKDSLNGHTLYMIDLPLCRQRKGSLLESQ